MTFLFVPGLQSGTGIDLYDSRHLERGSQYATRDVWKSALHVQDATRVLVDTPCSPLGSPVRRGHVGFTRILHPAQMYLTRSSITALNDSSIASHVYL